MTDILIRDVPDEITTALDARAASLGLSRSEYIRRRLAQEVAPSTRPTSPADLVNFSETFADLADPEVMRGAWS